MKWLLGWAWKGVHDAVLSLNAHIAGEAISFDGGHEYLVVWPDGYEWGHASDVVRVLGHIPSYLDTLGDFEEGESSHF